MFLASAASASDPSPPPDESWHEEFPAVTRTHGEPLIEGHLYLVRAAVRRIKACLPPHIEADDLHSAGLTGLVAAARKCDPDRLRTFAAYAIVRIRGAIFDELRRMDWCPRHARARARQLLRATHEIEQKFGRAATPREIRAALGLSAAEYARWIEETRPVQFVALDWNPTDGESRVSSLHEVLADDNDVTGRDLCVQTDQRRVLAQRLAALPERSRRLLAMYYFEGKRLSEIGAVFGLTESRISQLHARALRCLRRDFKRMCHV